MFEKGWDGGGSYRLILSMWGSVGPEIMSDRHPETGNGFEFWPR